MSYQSFSQTMADKFTESFKGALSLLGEAATKSFYRHIRRKYAMGPADLPHRVRDFDKALAELFGKGATTIVRTCAEKLREKLGGKPAGDPRSLSELWLEATHTRMH